MNKSKNYFLLNPTKKLWDSVTPRFLAFFLSSIFAYFLWTNFEKKILWMLTLWRRKFFIKQSMTSEVIKDHIRSALISNNQIKIFIYRSMTSEVIQGHITSFMQNPFGHIRLCSWWYNIKLNINWNATFMLWRSFMIF